MISGSLCNGQILGTLALAAVVGLLAAFRHDNPFFLREALRLNAAGF